MPRCPFEICRRGARLQLERLAAPRDEASSPFYWGDKTRARRLSKRIIVDGDDVAVEFQGQNRTRAGKDYNNTYCAVLRMANGKIVELTEYLDTALDPPLG